MEGRKLVGAGGIGQINFGSIDLSSLMQPGALTAPLSFGIDARVGSYGSGVYAIGTLPGAYAVRNQPTRADRSPSE